MKHIVKHFFKIRYLFILMIMMLVFVPGMTPDAATKMKVHFVDVGQGDATLIQYGSSNTLIDTGKESEYIELKRYLEKNKIKTIDGLVLTHPDADHVGGADLLKCFSRNPVSFS